MQLHAIEQTGRAEGWDGDLPEPAVAAIEGTVALYERVGHHAPWLNYLAVEDGTPVGLCGFTGAPSNGRVEIAYFTLPPHEGRGVATRMAGELVGIARRHAPEVRITAHTLPEHNASTRILSRLGFDHVATVDHPEDGTIWVWELPDPA